MLAMTHKDTKTKTVGSVSVSVSLSVQNLYVNNKSQKRRMSIPIHTFRGASLSIFCPLLCVVFSLFCFALRGFSLLCVVFLYFALLCVVFSLFCFALRGFFFTLHGFNSLVHTCFDASVNDTLFFLRFLVHCTTHILYSQHHNICKQHVFIITIRPDYRITFVHASFGCL